MIQLTSDVYDVLFPLDTPFTNVVSTEGSLHLQSLGCLSIIKRPVATSNYAGFGWLFSSAKCSAGILRTRSSFVEQWNKVVRN